MMNVVSTLTLRHLQVNKKRTVVTILGIAAATALITTMLTGVASFFAFFGTIAYHEMGHWDASLKNLSAEQIRELKADARIANVAVLDKTLDITGIRAESDVSQRLQLGNITHMDRQRIENRVTCSYDGALPSNEKEVAVEEKFLKDNDLDLQVGDPITLEVGNRYILEADGSRSTLGGPYRTDEAFESLYRETYTVTAIFHDNAPTEGFDVVHCMAEGYLPAENQVDICLKKVDMRALKVLEEIARDHNLTYEGWNSEYLISVFAIHWDGNGISAILPLGLVCLLIILATAVILIYNAFGMSLAERMRYLGMLASVGASRRQKRGSVYFEAFILGIFGIPLGILLGYLGAYFTLAVLGKQMVEANMIAGAKGFVDHIPVKIPLPALVFIVGISALTIFISALIPALKASRVMPIEALRQTNVIKVSRRRLRINPLIRKIFGYEGELAYKNIKRNGIKGSVITVSIAVSVAMFLVITHYCDSIQKLNNLDWSLPYQINAGCALDQQEMLEQILDEMPEVEDYYVSHFLEYHFRELPNQPDVIPAKSDALKAEYRKKDYQENFSETGMLLCSIPDEDFNRLLEANGIDPAPFYEDGELQAVLLNDYIRSSKKGSVFTEGVIGQRVYFEEQGKNPPSFTIAGLVNYEKGNYIFDLVPKKNVVAYAPNSTFLQKMQEILGEDATIGYNIITPHPDEVEEKLADLMEKEGLRSYFCSNVDSSLATLRVVMLLLKTVMYGFTTLITLIALANMVNTIYTGVILRRKEFAMFRSVGMTEKGFRKMISLETILYGVRALVVAIPLALFLSYAMTEQVNAIIPFEVNVWMYLIAVAVVFLMIGLSMLMSISKLRNDEIIEVLKEDFSI